MMALNWLRKCIAIHASISCSGKNICNHFSHPLGKGVSLLHTNTTVNHWRHLAGKIDSQSIDSGG